MTPEERLQILEDRINFLEKTDRYTLQKLLQFFDGRNIQLGNTTGTKIGTASTQKLGFFNKTPIVRPGAISAPVSQTGTYSQSDAQSIVNSVNAIRTALINLGLTA